MTQLIPFPLANTGGTLTKGGQISLDNSNFNNNIDNTITNVQQLADAFDNLNISSMGGTTHSVGSLIIDIAPRIDIGTDISGSHNIRYRAYDHSDITSLSLFIDQGGLFSTVALTAPTSDGEHSQTITFPNVSTSSEKTIVFYLISNGNVIGGAYVIRVENLEASDVKVDDTNLNSVIATNAQQVASELERLYGIVSRLQTDNRPTQRSLIVFNDNVTITSTNFNNYVNKNAIYAAGTDKRVSFQLPTEANINSYPAVFEISHFGGTRRIEGGFNPDNTIRVNRPTDYSDSDLSSYLRLGTKTGSSRTFSELHRGDVGIFIKDDADSPWVFTESFSDPRTSILPSGVFKLNNSRGLTFPTNVNGDYIVGGLSLYSPIAGDAFTVVGSGVPFDSTFGRKIDTGDVLVAKIDNPNRLLDSSNDDWLIIREAGHGELTLQEIRFLNQVTEIDRDVNTRIKTTQTGGNNETLVWLSPFLLDHAPFLTPTTDTNNPQSGETERYVGGRENIDSNGDFTFTSDLPQEFLYVGLHSSILQRADVDTTDIFVEVVGLDGNVIQTLSLDTKFVKPSAFTDTSYNYFVYSSFNLVDSFTEFRYRANQKIRIVLRTQNRHFTLSDSIDVTTNVNALPESRLSETVQAKLNKEVALDAVDNAKLEAITTTSTPSAIPVSQYGFTYKLKRGAPTHTDSDYHETPNIGDLRGIIADYDNAIEYTIRVPDNVTVTHLNQSIGSDIPVTEITPSLFGGERTYTATVPRFTASPPSTIFDNEITLVGSVSNTTVTGMDDSWKVRLANLDQSVLDRIGSGSNNNEYTLPDNLQRLNRDLSINDRTVSGWRSLQTGDHLPKLTRQYAFGWDENRRTFGNDNYFSDLQGVEFISYNANNIFYYNTPNDPTNRVFPGVQSFIENAPIRARNRTGQTVISSSHRKIIGFDYSLQRTLTSGDNVPMVRLGNTSTTPLLALTHDEGLYLNIGRGDGGTHTRTYQSPLQVIGSQWGTSVGQTTNGEAEVIIPNDLSGSVSVVLDIQLFDVGNDEGTHEETVTITNVGADQNLGQRTFDFAGFPSVTVDIIYEHNNTDLSTPRRVLTLVPTTAFSNAALVYNVRAHRNITETWTSSTTYARRPINAGSGHDDFGLFDPTGWNTEHVDERNRVILMLRTYRDNDQSADPEMAVQIIVDGETEGQPSERNIIRLHRPASDFMFNDILIGNNIVATGHIQVYDYDNESLITESLLLNYYNNADRWFGLFTNASEHVDQFVFNAEVEIQYEAGLNRGVIIASPNGTRHRITVSDTSVITATQIT